MSKPTDEAENTPVTVFAPVVSVSSMVLLAPGCAANLQVRVSALCPEDPSWPAGHAALSRTPNPLGRVECK